MSVNKEVGPQPRDYSRCQIAHLPGKSCSSCAEAAREEVDCLLLCERHALEAKLEGQIECWEEMLFHIELWSKEAKRQRPDVVGLLEDQRTKAISASHRAYEDLDVLRRSETPLGKVSSAGGGELFSRVRRSSLPLPPRGVQQFSGGLPGLRRR
jgi:hypothetical protein